MSELEILSAAVSCLLALFIAYCMCRTWEDEIKGLFQKHFRRLAVKYFDLAFTAAFMAVIFQLVGRLFSKTP